MSHIPVRTQRRDGSWQVVGFHELDEAELAAFAATHNDPLEGWKWAHRLAIQLATPPAAPPIALSAPSYVQLDPSIERLATAVTVLAQALTMMPVNAGPPSSSPPAFGRPFHCRCGAMLPHTPEESAVCSERTNPELKPCSWCGARAVESLERINGADATACGLHLLDLGAVLAGDIKAPVRPSKPKETGS